jgi:hypothetical protein
MAGKNGNGNVLYYGDNLDVLRRHVKDESVDAEDEARGS